MTAVYDCVREDGEELEDGALVSWSATWVGGRMVVQLRERVECSDEEGSE